VPDPRAEAGRHAGAGGAAEAGKGREAVLMFTEAFLADVRARSDVRELVGREVALKRKGRDLWGCCPFHGEKSPSFVAYADHYHCYGCGAHGDAVDWLRTRGGLTFEQAIEELAVQAGLIPDREGRVRPKKAPVAAAVPGDDAAERQNKIAWSRGLWAECRPAAGTLVCRYLAARGITLEPPPSIRFHPALWHADEKADMPAMVAAVQDGGRDIVGVHRTYLWPDGRGKSRGKKMAGVCKGGAIRLAPAAATLAVAEGIETALSVMEATGLPAWAAMSRGWLAEVALPPIVREVALFVDADDADPEAAERHIAAAVAAHAAAGRKVRVARPPKGFDFNDVLRGGNAGKTGQRPAGERPSQASGCSRPASEGEPT
jgi:hypothetical protein